MIIYIDQIVGISGDMLLTALLDLAEIKIDKLIKFLPIQPRLKSLIKIEKVLKNDILAPKIAIPNIEDKISYRDFKKLIDDSKFPNQIKQKAHKAADTLAKIESKIHNISINKFHFHNYIDFLIEILGVFYLVEELKIDEVYSSEIKLTRGFVKCCHGILPVPAPATLELVKNMPVKYIEEIDKETTTPTGVLLLKLLNPKFYFPNMCIKKIGYAAGYENFEIPNILRVFLAEKADKNQTYEYDTIIKIETNIDNMNPILYEQLIEQLYKDGCYEVFLTNTINKKFRLGVLLTVLLPENIFDKVLETIFFYSTTIGIRFEKINRVKLKRREIELKTNYGKIKAKEVILPQGKKEIFPEYEDLKEVSKRYSVPIKTLLKNLKLI